MPAACAAVLCAESKPLSRVAQASANGACSFVDECQDAADCVVAYNAKQCCGCAESMPAQLVDSEPCLLGPDEDVIPQECAVACPLIACGACPGPPEPSCVIGDSLNVCR